METSQALNWLKKHDLHDMAKEVAFFLKKTYVTCLGVKDERILIIGDKGSKNRRISAVMSGAYYLAAEDLKLNAKLVLQDVKSKGTAADEDTIRSLAELKENSIICVNASDRLGSIKELGKSFRKYCQKKNYRFVSAPSLGDLETKRVYDIIKCIDINYKPMQATLDALRKKLTDAKEIHITSPAGTDVYFDVNGMTASVADGNYTTPGKGGNIPAGESYLPPNGKGVNGKVVIDGSSRNHKHTAMIKKPIVLTIEDGSITQIEGHEEAKLLERTLAWAESRSKNPKTVRRIGELGIGVNPKASIIGATLVDEKTLGTAHIGIGSNYWFGGSIYAIIHLDQVFKNPKIVIDGEELKL